MNHSDLDLILVVLLIVDMTLTVYGVWAFTASQKTCKEMLDYLVANCKH